MAGRRMHQTTVRFGPDLWAEIEVEAARAGISVAQYVRDSTLMRVAYTRGRDGDPHYEAALTAAESSVQGNGRMEQVRSRARDRIEDDVLVARRDGRRSAARDQPS